MFIIVSDEELEEYDNKIEHFQKKELRNTCKKMGIKPKRNASIEELDELITVEISSKIVIKVPWNQLPWCRGE